MGGCIGVEQWKKKQPHETRTHDTHKTGPTLTFNVQHEGTHSEVILVYTPVVQIINHFT